MAERSADAGDEPDRPRRAARLAERKEAEQKEQAEPPPGQAGLPDAEEAGGENGAAEHEVAGAAPADPLADPGAPVLPAAAHAHPRFPPSTFRGNKSFFFFRRMKNSKTRGFSLRFFQLFYF